MELPEELIDEILLRLPIDSLIRLKAVSKQWLRLITSNRFAFGQYHRMSQDNPTSSFLFLRSDIRDGDMKFIAHVSVVGESHDPLRLTPIDYSGPNLFARWGANSLFPAGFGIYYLFQQYTGTVFLWNPATRQTKVLPPSPYYKGAGAPPAYPSNFGTVDYKDEKFSYKVCRVSSRVTNPDDMNPSHITLSLEIYSSETQSWKLVHDFSSGVYFGYFDRTFHPVNLKGRAHWVTPSVGAEDFHITTFGYQTEAFGRIGAPSAPPEVVLVGGYDESRCIVTLFDDKFLCLVLFWIKDNNKFVDIWVMREYGVEDSWTKEFTLGPIPKGMEVMAFSSKVQGMFLRPMRHSYDLIYFDCNSLKMTWHHFGASKFMYQILQVVQYRQSLVSVVE